MTKIDNIPEALSATLSINFTDDLTSCNNIGLAMPSPSSTFHSCLYLPGIQHKQRLAISMLGQTRLLTHCSHRLLALLALQVSASLLKRAPSPNLHTSDLANEQTSRYFHRLHKETHLNIALNLGSGYWTLDLNAFQIVYNFHRLAQLNDAQINTAIALLTDKT